MIIDIRTLPDATVIEADLCIIGGGAAAIAMAMQLRDKPLKVCILESGGLTFDRTSQSLADGEASGVPYFSLSETSYRLLGGNTFRWGARVSPLKPIDFSPRPWIPLSGWPISRNDLDPYYDRVYDFVGLHKPFTYEGDVFAPFNLDPPETDADRLQYCAFQFGKNLLLGEVYQRELEQARNLSVYLNATVQKIQSESAVGVTGVSIASLAGQRYVAQAKFYVLACGGIENARLLLLSGRDHGGGLCNEHDLVGRYFMEHPTVLAGRIVSNRWQKLHDVFSPGLVSGRLVETGLALSPSVQERERCLNAIARTTLLITRDSTQALREILANLKYRRMPHQLDWYKNNKWLAQRVGAIARDPLGIVWNMSRHVRGKPKRFRADAMFLEVRSEQEPNPNSRVTLSSAQRDAFGQPRAHLHWELTYRDKHTMRTIATMFHNELTRLDLGELHQDPWLTTDELVWPSDMVGGHHHMGTTRMSDDPKTGVVDANCRTHAHHNLYIAGSSVFPTAGYVNPTATLLALAMRLADHLRAKVSG